MCASVLCIKKGECKGDVSLHCLFKYLVKKNNLNFHLKKPTIFQTIPFPKTTVSK